MSHILEYKEWQSPAGHWYCNDTKDIGSSQGGLWWVSARMLNISLVDYVKMLINEFKVDNISYNQERDVLVYSWQSQSKMRNFKNWLNAEARKRQFYV